MNINKLKLLISAVASIVGINDIYANPNDNPNSKSSYDLNTNLHLSTSSISEDVQPQNKTEPTFSPVLHSTTEAHAETENISNSTIVFSDSYSMINNHSQNISIQSIDDDNLSEIPNNYNDNDDFFSDEEEGNELVEALNNNIDKSETKDHSGSNSY